MGLLSSMFGQRLACDTCGRAFRPDLEDDSLPDGGALRRFACPHCGHQYFVARISARGVALTKEIQELNLRSRGASKTLKWLRSELRKEVNRP